MFFHSFNFLFRRYIVVAKKLDGNAVPSKDPATYTSTQIENNEDGLFVAKIITDRAMFGKKITIQSTSGSKRKRRGIFVVRFVILFDHIDHTPISGF